MRSLFLSCVFVLTLAASAHGKLLTADHVRDAEPLLPYFSWLADPEGKRDIASVAFGTLQERFAPLENGIPLKNPGAVWLRLVIVKSPPGSTGGAVRADRPRLVMRLGELPPGGARMFISESPGPVAAPGVWHSETVVSHSDVLLPEPGLLPMSVYVRLDSMPGLWFSPTISPQGALRPALLPSELLLPGLLIVACAVCLLRAVAHRAQWALWAAAFLLCVLVQAVLPLPDLNRGVSARDLPAMLAPGMALLLLPHVGRHMFRARGVSVLQDAILHLCSIIGTAVCLAPLAPGMTWLARLFPLWPLLLFPLLPVCVSALARKSPGALSFAGACAMALLGAALTLHAVGMSSPSFPGAQGSLWGLALSGLGLALARIPGEAAAQQHGERPAVGLDFVPAPPRPAGTEEPESDGPLPEDASGPSPSPPLALEAAGTAGKEDSGLSLDISAFAERPEEPAGDAASVPAVPAASSDPERHEEERESGPESAGTRPCSLPAEREENPASAWAANEGESESEAGGALRDPEDPASDAASSAPSDHEALAVESAAEENAVVMGDMAANGTEAPPEPASEGGPDMAEDALRSYGPGLLPDFAGSSDSDFPAVTAPREISLTDENFFPYSRPPLDDWEEAPRHTTLTSSGSFLFNLHSLVREVHDNIVPLAKNKGLLFSWYITPSLPALLEGDAPRLRGALSLLLQNAVQATRQGAVQLAVRKDPGGSEPGALLFSISDSGSAQRTDAGFFHAWELAARTGGGFAIDYSPGGGTQIAFTARFALPSEEAAREHLAGLTVPVRWNGALAHPSRKMEGAEFSSSPAMPEVQTSALHEAHDPDNDEPISVLWNRAPLASAAPGRASSPHLPEEPELAAMSPEQVLERQGFLEPLPDQADYAPAATGFRSQADLDRPGAIPLIVAAEMTNSKRRLLSHYLGDLPHEHIDAANNSQAISLVRERAVSLFIVDADMPEPDIVKTLDALRREERKRGRIAVPVLALTNHEAQSRRMIKAGATHTLCKPFSRDGLREVVLLAAPALAASLPDPEAVPRESAEKYAPGEPIPSFEPKEASSALFAASSARREGGRHHREADLLEAALRDAPPPRGEPVLVSLPSLSEAAEAGKQSVPPAAPIILGLSEDDVTPYAGQKAGPPLLDLILTGAEGSDPLLAEDDPAAGEEPRAENEEAAPKGVERVAPVVAEDEKPASEDEAPPKDMDPTPKDEEAARAKDEESVMPGVAEESVLSSPTEEETVVAEEAATSLSASPPVLADVPPPPLSAFAAADEKEPAVPERKNEEAVPGEKDDAHAPETPAPDRAASSAENAATPETPVPSASPPSANGTPVSVLSVNGPPVSVPSVNGPPVRVSPESVPLMSALFGSDPEAEGARSAVPEMFALPGLDGEAVDASLLPLIPGLIHALSDALADVRQGRDSGKTILVQEAAGRLAGRAEIFGLQKLGKIGRCVERAAEADDLEAVSTLLEDLDIIAKRYITVLQESFQSFLNLDR